jgi:hypothetical protein
MLFTPKSETFVFHYKNSFNNWCVKIKTYVPYSILISNTFIANIVKWIELGQTWIVN